MRIKTREYPSLHEKTVDVDLMGGLAELVFSPPIAVLCVSGTLLLAMKKICVRGTSLLAMKNKKQAPTTLIARTQKAGWCLPCSIARRLLRVEPGWKTNSDKMWNGQRALTISLCSTERPDELPVELTAEEEELLKE